MNLKRAWILAGVPLVFAAAIAACGDGGSNTQASSSSSSSSGEAGSGGMGGQGGAAGGMGGMGGKPECQVAADCTNQGVANFCGEPACEAGKCIRKLLQPEGTPLPSQTYGDCIDRKCDALGEIVDAFADSDAYNDGNDCTMDLCMNGVLSHELIVAGMPCGGGVCDGAGVCVECIDPAKTCVAPKICIAGFCAGNKCNNMTKDPGEGDIDCGGACAPCEDGKTCSQPGQCKSGVCTAGLCAVPTCMDTVQNGKETALDCGGADCSPCPNDAPCFVTSDCQSGVCVDNFCIPPSCTDAVQNGDEAGVDCGGAVCDPCP